jgi:hypothetical protein
LLAQTNDPRKAEADRFLQQGIQQFQTSQFREALQSWEQAKQLYQAVRILVWDSTIQRSLSFNKHSPSTRKLAIDKGKLAASAIWALRTRVWDSTIERSISINNPSPSTPTR